MSQNIKLRVAEDSSGSPSETRSTAGKPSKVLPTVRISFPKQQDILRAYAVAGNGKAASLKEVAEIVQMVSTTISLGNPFFTDVKLIHKTDTGLTPAYELLEYKRAYEWDKETAFHKLAPLLANAWFWQALQPRLNFDKLTEEQAITLLAEKSAAGPTYKGQLKMILDYLDEAGMIKRENGHVSILKGGQQAADVVTPAAAASEPEMVENQPPQVARRAGVATNFAQKAGVISFDISVRVDMNELVGWEPAKISAFFAGIAQVVSAKGVFEKDTIKE